VYLVPAWFGATSDQLLMAVRAVLQEVGAQVTDADDGLSAEFVITPRQAALLQSRAQATMNRRILRRHRESMA
jgi:hypothetical protein